MLASDERTPQTHLPLLMPAQTLRYTTLNEALGIIDALLQLCVEGVLDAPPFSTEDAAYIVGPDGPGAFAGHEGHIAVYRYGALSFISPKWGWRSFDRSAKHYKMFDCTNWVGVSEPPLEVLGINATADGVNRLSIASDAVLMSQDGAEI